MSEADEVADAIRRIHGRPANMDEARALVRQLVDASYVMIDNIAWALVHH